ncbi:MAG: helix-turn-helix domain-containing protein [Clostridia bacterium]|nr:helix-turn-helix domain-containing protein [Clostridia bacterium]
MTNDLITDDTPIAMLTVGQLKKLWTHLQCAMANPTSVQPSDKEIMNLEEVVQLTGYSKSAIYKLVHQRKIPFYKSAHGGRKLYFMRKDILDWMQGQRIPAIEQEDKKCARKLCRR